jgi:hypothetical protein
MTEWKIIKKYSNYSVSNDGNIKNNTTQRILKYYIRNGYKSITLSVNNKKKTLNIHTIVAEQFLVKPHGVYVVNHINEDKLDNRVINLEYTTYRENTMHSMTSNRSRNTMLFELNDFKEIPGYSQYMISRNGDVYSKIIKRLCCKTILPNGYHKIKLKGDSKYKDMYIHVLVAITYLHHTPSSKYVVNHIDGNKGNNVVDNLEIITHKENMSHSVKLNDKTIFRRAVCYTNSNGEIIQYRSAKEASVHTGVDNSSILKSCKNENKLAGKIKWRFMSTS